MIRSIVIVAVTLVATAATAADTRVSYFPVTPNSGAHDVAPAPDGSVYYTGQAKGYLGRLDPKTGKDENIPIGAGSARPGSPTAASTPMCASIRRPGRSNTSCCRRSCPPRI